VYAYRISKIAFILNQNAIIIKHYSKLLSTVICYIYIYIICYSYIKVLPHITGAGRKSATEFPNSCCIKAVQCLCVNSIMQSVHTLLCLSQMTSTYRMWLSQISRWQMSGPVTCFSDDQEEGVSSSRQEVA